MFVNIIDQMKIMINHNNITFGIYFITEFYFLEQTDKF